VDNGSSHAGKTRVQRLQTAWPNLIRVHFARTCRLAQSDRELLLDPAAQSTDPEAFHNLDELAARTTAFQAGWQQPARPIDWRYTRRDLNDLLDRLNERHHLAAAA
jgi:hypothetical protein